MQVMLSAGFIILTVGIYLICRYLYFRYNHPLINIVLLSAAVIIAILVVGKQDYAAYTPAKDVMTFLLGPATVALAVPLYRNRHLLKQYGIAIFTGVGLGTLVSMASVLFITQIGGLSREIIVSIIPKSSTVPFAVEVAALAGGNPALAVAFVVATGTFGSVIGLSLLSRFKIYNPVARGLAMGTVSHGQGTAMALLEGEQPGAMAGVAMALAGIFTSVLAPVLIALFVG
ncbi:putative effector of murein hydrolase [uncultured Sporomusa sp.]|uniref:Putative effector of murein hydrolase n=1 Tax=uncultured Sporomusa sp. TaxID=307249 RepID=A0A212LNE1_9FIRM|nr:LrgB family protein [uncultured Sporomusa sp.]SCM79041.1 putative effector of murein hydrolase [uncultured Sporomusa sp.]